MVKPRPFTKEEKDRYEKKLALYDYYGIPYLVFDGEEAAEHIRKDRWDAVRIIETGGEIPEDLGKRLLEYKRAEEEQKNQNTKMEQIV